MGIVVLSSPQTSALASTAGAGPLVLLAQTHGTRPTGFGALGKSFTTGPVTAVGGGAVPLFTLADLLSPTAASAGVAPDSGAPLVLALGISGVSAGATSSSIDFFLQLMTSGAATAGGFESGPASFWGYLNAPTAAALASASSPTLVQPLDIVAGAAGGIGSALALVDLLDEPTGLVGLLSIATNAGLTALPSSVDVSAGVVADGGLTLAGLLPSAPVSAQASASSLTLHIFVTLGVTTVDAGATSSSIRLGPLPTPLAPTPVATIRLAGRILSPPTLVTIAGLSAVGSPVPAASAGLRALPRGTPITLYYAALGAADITWLESLGVVYASLSYGDPLRWSPPVAVVVACTVGAAQLGSDGYQAQVTLTPAQDVPLTTTRWAAGYY